MTKRKGIEPAVQLVSACQNATMLIANRVTTFGGNYTVALVRIGMGERRYNAELDQLANIYAKISAGNTTEIVAPEGGRVHIVHVLVDESSEWNPAIDTGFPNTPSNYNVRKVGDQYPPNRSARPTEREIILVSFCKDVPNTDPVLTWGKAQKLTPASPRSIFALGEHKPRLHTELGQSILIVVSLKECNFSGHRPVPGGWWSGDGRKARLFWSDVEFGVDCWFAFVRE